MIRIIPNSDIERITGRVTARRAGDGAPLLFIGVLNTRTVSVPHRLHRQVNAVLIVGRGFGADNLHFRPTAGAFHDGKRV
jgi:hypothetical protein